MDYKQILAQEGLQEHLPEGLVENLANPDVPDIKIEYSHPPIEPYDAPRMIKRVPGVTSRPPRLPARINNPLIPYPCSILSYMCTGDEKEMNLVHPHHHRDLVELRKYIHHENIQEHVGCIEISNEINLLKRMTCREFSIRMDLINMAACSFARRGTKHELSIITKSEVKAELGRTIIPKRLSFLLTIQRLRMFLSKMSNDVSSLVPILSESEEEPVLHSIGHGHYTYSRIVNQSGFCMISVGNHFALYHTTDNIWFVGNMTYLDYMFTVADISNNLTIISAIKEYEWLEKLILLLQESIDFDCEHNDMVNLMKSLEGFILNLSDYDTSHAMNWRPLMDAVAELRHLDMKITSTSYNLTTCVRLMEQHPVYYDKKSFLCRIIEYSMKLTRTQRQEFSSLHKFIFYAEINAMDGVTKFLKRVHTERKCTPEAVRNITRLAKCKFLNSYAQKHQSLPNLRGDNRKIAQLNVWFKTKRLPTELTLPLIWWDDLEIFNCMDNKLTNDPLEFAKDKGALKSEVRFGPGDSRKELLQVIEKDDYVLKEHIGPGGFTPRVARVYSISQLKHPFPTEHPVRLIEKEREQKIEARLFANGELSDKHALSLVTTKIKKALAYFDEQMMTPQDSKRKILLHNAAQKIIDNDYYSLLLDIEGHNQSMQWENVHELSDFFGKLYGYENWADLQHYYSMIDVYHYDEYENKGILSQGQKGSIEGWNNPLWTAHTTLMLQLLRVMTSLIIDQVMVYSDDADVIIKIEQATTSTVDSVFSELITHCAKFGMIVKYSQTTLSKHRVTMLRQHYADGIRADSTLKKLISTSGGNNQTLFSEELEVAAICSSISSALELTNQSFACIYLKNYKLGLLLSRLLQSILIRPDDNSVISIKNLPKRLVQILYHTKDDKTFLLHDDYQSTMKGLYNEIASYLHRSEKSLDKSLGKQALHDLYGTSLANIKYIDSAERMLYLQIYDPFLMDLLFFIIHLPASLGGLGGILCIDLMLSGHSSGLTKSLGYLKSWIDIVAVEKSFFYDYLGTVLSVKSEMGGNFEEERIIQSHWPSCMSVTTATNSIQQAIKSVIIRRTRNKSILKVIDYADQFTDIQKDLVNIFRQNYHPRIGQFYYENSSVHFLDLLINKIETSSGFVGYVKNLWRLRQSIGNRTIENIRKSSTVRDFSYGIINSETDIVEYLKDRRQKMFSDVKFIDVEELLYEDNIEECSGLNFYLMIRRSSPMHFENGLRVYDTPQFGNEVRYKGELLDNDRLISSKEEYLTAKVTAVTKWIITKYIPESDDTMALSNLDCVKACNLCLNTLTGQTLTDLWNYSPSEIGGEILHRIPNMRFSTKSSIRVEMSYALKYTSELNQGKINASKLQDSNINFDYLRLRYTLKSMFDEKIGTNPRVITRYTFKNLVGIRDVQFIKPQSTTYNVKSKPIPFTCISKNQVSIPRLRYLTVNYLNTDSIIELTGMPNMDDTQMISGFSNDIVESLIYSHSRKLDNAFMNVCKFIPNSISWEPIYERLSIYQKEFKTYTDTEKNEFIRQKLQNIYEKTGAYVTVHATDHLKIAFQTACLGTCNDIRYDDDNLARLTRSVMTQINRNVSVDNLNRVTKKCKRLIASQKLYRREVGINLIVTYLLTFHFHTLILNRQLQLDVGKIMQSMAEYGVSRGSFLIFNPELITSMDIIGFDFIYELMTRESCSIRELLHTVNNDNLMTDMIVPLELSSLKEGTRLTGNESTPLVVKSMMYRLEQISDRSMATLNEINPLLNFAEKCSYIGSSNLAFSSPTGSDSLCSQYGLFSILQNDYSLDKSVRICDLTAGRGDMQYVARDLGLNVHSYSRPDIFTSFHYHPLISFKDNYDVFKTDTIKFATAYDWIHIDVSFTGDSMINILDLILMLEEMSLPYSIRLNSVSLKGYSGKCLEGLPEYTHAIAYPPDSYMKPYQIYLVGIPSDGFRTQDTKSFKESIAFRSIALAYARLLSAQSLKFNYDILEPNSATIFFEDPMEGEAIILESIHTETDRLISYYGNRLLNEILDDDHLIWVQERLDPLDAPVIERLTDNFTSISENVYIDYTNDDIGNVSESSRKYHELHLSSLKSGEFKKTKCDFLKVEHELLEYFRIHHPLQDIRTKCNIALGCLKFIRKEELINRTRLNSYCSTKAGRTTSFNCRHQEEYREAIQLILMCIYKGDMSYGIKYCRMHNHLMGLTNERVFRILKLHRLLLPLHTKIRMLINTNAISLDDMIAVEHRLSLTKLRRDKTTNIRQRRDHLPITDEDREFEIQIDIDKLFSSIEDAIIGKATPNIVDQNDLDVSNIFESANLDMDIDVGDMIDQYVEEHMLIINPITGIYEGFDEAPPDDMDNW